MTTTVSLSLFGAPTVAVGGVSRALERERRTQLVVYLALKRAWVGRAELAALLWPDHEAKLAQTNLRKTLFRLQATPWTAAVEQQGGSLRLDIDTDVHRFENALREQCTDEALALYRGDLLAGFDDDANDAWSGWLQFERERLRVGWRGAAHLRLAGEMDTVAAIELATRLLEADPLDDEALRACMQWLARGGQGARARQLYRGFCDRLSAELGLAPSVELRALYDSLAGASVRAAVTEPDQASIDDGFIGRAAELRRAAALLAQGECRLLTILGPGGVGKTRLARRVLLECAPRFADGAVFVPLDDLRAARELPARLARELEVSLKGRADPLDEVIDALRAREVLLALDNFEQLAEAAPAVDRLLAACPNVKIIVTSRMRLAVAAEWLLPLEGLPCPEDEDFDRIESFDAARLFVRAALRVQPALVPATEAAAIVDICRQVEGLPLALELAAAWTRVLSCAAIAEELRQGTELLRTTESTQPSRHASIEVVFEQSWRLLTDIEREVLARLSVFHGGFSLEAARAVAKAPLPVLGALADKSLLHKQQRRMRLHPLVQQFAAARLGNSEDRHAADRAHARYFNDQLHQLRRSVENGERDALAQVESEFENCRAAWRWAAADRQPLPLRRAVPALTNFCDHRSRFDEGLTLLREAAESVSARDDAALRALLLGKAAHLEYRLDRYADAIVTATRGLDVLGELRDADARGQCLMVLGTCQLRLGNSHEAIRYLEESLELSPDCSDVRHRAGMLTALALAQKGLGNYDASLRLSLEALQEQRRLGDVASEALSLNNLAAFSIERLQFEAATGYLKSALALCERHGLVMTRGAVLLNLMLVAAKTGQYEAADAYGARALEHAQAVGNRFYLSFLSYQFAASALRRGDLPTARAELRTGMMLGLDIGRPMLLIQGLVCFGEILAALGEVACARAVIRFATEHPLTTPLDRDEILQRIAQWPAEDAPSLRWPPALSLDEAARLVVAETDLGYASLMNALRAKS